MSEAVPDKVTTRTPHQVNQEVLKVCSCRWSSTQLFRHISRDDCSHPPSEWTNHTIAAGGWAGLDWTGSKQSAGFSGGLHDEAWRVRGAVNLTE